MGWPIKVVFIQRVKIIHYGGMSWRNTYVMYAVTYMIRRREIRRGESPRGRPSQSFPMIGHVRCAALPRKNSLRKSRTSSPAACQPGYFGRICHGNKRGPAAGLCRRGQSGSASEGLCGKGGRRKSAADSEALQGDFFFGRDSWQEGAAGAQ